MAESIELLGVELPTRTSDDPELVEQSVKLVQEKIEAIEESASGASRMQIALLSALNLAGEVISRDRESTPPGISEKTIERLEAVHQQLKEVEDFN